MSIDRFSLDGRVALVTGASSGIGTEYGSSDNGEVTEL